MGILTGGFAPTSGGVYVACHDMTHYNNPMELAAHRSIILANMWGKEVRRANVDVLILFFSHYFASFLKFSPSYVHM